METMPSLAQPPPEPPGRFGRKAGEKIFLTDRNPSEIEIGSQSSANFPQMTN